MGTITTAQPELVKALLDQLERCSDTQDKAAKDARRTIWDELAPHFGKRSPQDLVDELAHELGVQPITIRRWVSGEYAPRAALLKRIRAHFGIGQPASVTDATNIGPDAPVPFGGPEVYGALRTIDHFFYSLRFARSCFMFKGMLGFHAGRSQRTREQVVDALTSNPELNLYYVFHKNTEAEVTFDKLKRGITLIDAESAERIHDIRVAKDHDKMGLGLSLASPFVVVYNEAGREKFRRHVDVWYEVPLERLTKTNEVNDYEPLFVFVQLPTYHSEDVWQEWRQCLQSLVHLDSKPEISEADLG